MIHVDFKDRTPIWEQLTRNITHLVVSGVLAPNEQLPSVRQLSGELGINPNTIQRSYRQLEMEGWIATVPGKGCFVCGAPNTALRQREDLLAQFDQTAAALMAMGLTPAELAVRLQKGGKHND